MRKDASQNENCLIRALSPAIKAELGPHLRTLNLSAGTILYEPGQRVEHAYFPNNCVVSLLAVLRDGGSAEVSVFGREGVLGYTSSLVSPTAFGRYVVQIPGTASRISLERLLKAARAHQQLEDLLLRFTEALLAQAFQIVACNAIHPVEARCCRWILSIQDRVNATIIPLTHEFLAEMMGVQRSTVTITTRMLQVSGVIEQRRGVISIIDRQGLEECSCECYHVIRANFERMLPGIYASEC